MSNFLKNLIKATPIVLGASLLVANSSVAATEDAGNKQLEPGQASLEQTNILAQVETDADALDENVADDSLDQLTSVSQLRDVSPTDWAYEALRNLVERYGCIVGYPDLTYRGNRALSRYEFAAGLNACMQQMERMIANSEAVLREDIEALKRLMKEFEAELAALGTRVDNLEGRVAFLEDHQFSTTTKLKGEVIFNFAALGSDDNKAGYLGGQTDTGTDEQATFSDRVRLNFETSFTGKDMLRTRLQAANVPNLGSATGTPAARLAFDENSGNDVILDDLFYRFPLGDKMTFWVGANGLDLDDVFQTFNPYLEGSGTGSISRFGRYNPISYRGPSGAGAAARYKFNDKFNVTATYLAPGSQSSDPSQGEGIFNGDFSAGIQLAAAPTDKIDIGLTYLHTYQSAGSVNIGQFGSQISGDPFDGLSAATSDRGGLQLSWNIAKKFNFSAWGGYASANAQGSNGSADIWTWMTNFNFLDLGREGAVLSLSGGMTPWVTGAEDGAFEDADNSYVIQAQYKYPLTDNILLTPGAYVILDPNNNSGNDTIFVGVMRTTFKF